MSIDLYVEIRIRLSFVKHVLVFSMWEYILRFSPVIGIKNIAVNTTVGIPIALRV